MPASLSPPLSAQLSDDFEPAAHPGEGKAQHGPLPNGAQVFFLPREMTVGSGNKCQHRTKMAPASSNCLAYAMGRRTPPVQPQLRRGPTPPKSSYSSAASSPFSRSGSASPVSAAPRASRPPGWIERHRAQVNSGLFLLCVALYWNSLAGDFVFDDVTAIRDNRDLRPHVPWRNLLYNDFWGTPMSKEQSHKSYRPVTVATFRLNYALGGLDPMGYHLVNVILHGAVTLLYHSLCARLLGGSGLTAVVAAALFAAHPVRCRGEPQSDREQIMEGERLDIVGDRGTGLFACMSGEGN